MHIQKATINELDSAAELFNLYRVFYDQQSDLDGAKKFLEERLSKQESVIFLAYEEKEAVGFTQLYPSFSSVSMKRTWVLNDLFVKENKRGKGIGRKLLNEAIHMAAETNAKGILLETGQDNLNAQRLYEKTGFKREANYFYFFVV